jgi:hypothetical protein
MVLGEQAGGWLNAKKIQAANVASARIVSKRKDQHVFFNQMNELVHIQSDASKITRLR